MARTAHRTVIISAAFALASWALVAGAPALAAATADRAGPQLPPAEYKPLPVGTIVTYDTWGYTVTKTEGVDIRFKKTTGDWKHRYAVFGKSGDAAYTPKGDRWRTTLDGESKAALESLWPLQVGNKTTFRLKEDLDAWGNAYGHRKWTVTLDVLKTEFIDLDGVRYATYVVRERAVNDHAITSSRETLKNYGEFIQTHWYEPRSGLILKSAKEWTRGPKKGTQGKYRLVRVRFPEGTKPTFPR